MVVRSLLQRRENIIVFKALEVKRTTGFAPPWKSFFRAD
jgi:hypothetical protein